MMTEAAPAYLAVARFDKPHGLKGEALVFALTDEPDAVFEPGRGLAVLDPGGQPTGTLMTIERARRYHRQWLVKFAGVPDRTTLDAWPRGRTFGLPASELTPPRNDQLYRHEMPGVTVMVGAETVGVVKDLAQAPGNDLLVIEIGGREHLVPYRRPIVKRVDRAARVIELDPPPGLFEL